MPDDVGGRPFEDGQEPDNRHHGGADEEFAAVVFDEDFVRAAEVHEPTAAERILAAGRKRAESESVLGRDFRDPHEDARYGHPHADGEFAEDADEGFDEFDDEDGRFGRYRHPGFGDSDPFAPGYGYGVEADFEHGSDYGYTYGPSGRAYAVHGGPRPYRGHARWQRPVAWVLAVVMGIGMVALAFSAVRGAGGQREEPTPPPATTGVGAGGAGPAAEPAASASASAETVPPASSAEPR